MALPSGGFVGTLAFFVYLGSVALSLPVAAAVLLLARRLGVGRAAVAVAVGTAGLLAIVAMAVAALAGLQPALVLAGVGLGALLLLWVVPVGLGAVIVARFAGLDPDAAIGYAVAGLPPAMVVSAILVVAPGGPTRYNLTFLTGPALWVASAAFLAVVLLGPGLAGVGLARYVRRGR